MPKNKAGTTYKIGLIAILVAAITAENITIPKNTPSRNIPTEYKNNNINAKIIPPANPAAIIIKKSLPFVRLRMLPCINDRTRKEAKKAPMIKPVTATRNLKILYPNKQIISPKKQAIRKKILVNEGVSIIY